LIYQNSKYAIDEQVAEPFSQMFPSLQKLDLRRGQITDEAVRKFLQAFSDKEPDHVSSIEKLDLTGCSFSQSALEDFDEINRRMAKNIIVFKAFDVQSENHTGRFCSCFRCCCCKRN
jgi:phosphate uptake regulator